MNYKEIVEARYNRQKWQELLYDIFRNKVQFWQQPQPVVVDESMAKRALYTGKINLPDGHTIAIYEVELSDSVAIERNRAGIRNLLCTNWRGMGCAGAFMFCFRQYEAVLRFSYVSEAFTFAEDGSLKKDSTDTKRFTYLLGEGHRSRTAIQQFEKLKASGLTLKDITKAFSVEALSDLFFKEYKKQYEDIIEFVTGKRMVKVANKWEEQVTGQPCREIMQEFGLFPDAEKAVRDYVKKLMGRLVFIQFLQKKGWMGCSAGESWNDGDREFVQNLFANTTHNNTFVDDVLEPLFLDINTKRDGDITSSQNVGDGIKIPYLNGGLFEKDDFDKTKFPLPAKYMKNLLDFFASYNFTIDENDPDDAEIGVDPEMLGRIFENLLEDNKDKGAFYTPKEIVQYMCRESLIAYLQTDVEDEAVKLQIREFVTTNNADLLSADLAESIDQKLKDVKICDPAIGSGAFPMGLLRELYACRKAIEGIDDGNAVRIKTHIIQNNIYGVDIEKGAVDIARLRFWLALIVDEDTPHALPNMDFKIMQGNSLLEQYEGVELSGMSLNEQKKRKTKKGDAYQVSLAFDEKIALENIQEAIKRYYLTDNHETKLNLRKTIDDNVKSYIRNLKGCTPDIQRKLEKLPIPNDQFFLWHIYFKEVFDKGGFDIVIGNPPYIQLQSMLEMSAAYKEAKFETYNKSGDIYCLFVEQGFKLLVNNGILTYIMPNKWLQAGYGQQLREYIAKKRILNIVDFGDMQLFENATTYTCIPLLKQAKPCKTFTASYMKSADISTISDYSNTFDSMDFGKGAWVLSSSGELKLINKLKKYPTLEKHLGQGAMFGIKTGLTDAFIIDERTCQLIVQDDINVNQRVFPFLLGRDIKPYASPSPNKYLILFDKGFTKQQYGEGLSEEAAWNHIKEDYPLITNWLEPFAEKGRKRGDKGDYWWELRACDYYDEFVKPKIMYQAFQVKPNFIYDETGCYCNNSMWILPTDNKALLGLLNSKMGWWLISKFCSQIQNGYQLIWKYFGQIPIALDEKQHSIVTLVDRILAAKKANPLADTTAEEREIDRLVYDLYGLTEDEIAIVEGTK